MKRIFSGIVAVLVASAMCMNAFAARAPQEYGQNKNNWCWAAASKIVAENNGGENPSISRSAQVLTNIQGVHNDYFGIDSSGRYTADGVQCAIVKYIFKNDGDNGGSDGDKTSALQYASAKDMDIGTKGYYKNELTSDMIIEINKDLMNGKYIIGNMTNSSYDYSHSVVIKSYDSLNDSYDVFNPWDKTERAVSAAKLFHSYGYKYSGNQIGRVSWFQYCR